jgi:hypothetical protein
MEGNLAHPYREYGMPQAIKGPSGDFALHARLSRPSDA